jgi:hypothetical protein
MGIFGYSWQEKVAANMGYPVTMLNASEYGSIVNTLFKLWTKNAKTGIDKYGTEMLLSLVADSGQPADKVRMFFAEMVKREKAGTVLSTSAPKGTTPFLQAKGMNAILAIAAVAVGAYALSQISSIGKLFKGGV